MSLPFRWMTSLPNMASKAPSSNKTNLTNSDHSKRLRWVQNTFLMAELGWGWGGRYVIRTPQARPKATATKISRGAWRSNMTMFVSAWFCWKVMPSRTVKQEMARTSSILAAAMTRLGIPFITPYPLSWRESRQDTTTAGLTAARENPIMAAQVQGRPSRRWLARHTAEVSMRQGSIASLKTIPDSCLSTCGLRPRQALRRMTTRAVVLVAAYHSGSTPCNTGTLATLLG